VESSGLERLAYLRRYADRFLATDYHDDAAFVNKAADLVDFIDDADVAEAVFRAVRRRYTMDLTLFNSAGPDPKPPAKPAATPAPATASVGTNAGQKYGAYGSQVLAGGSRAWRNNNPGNIKAGDFATRHGAIGADSGGFAIFPSTDTGNAAQSALLQHNYADDSIKDMISKYAPASDNNDPAAYARFVQQKTGIDPSVAISSLTATQLSSLTSAMGAMEGANQAGQTYTAGHPDNPAWVAPVLSNKES